jgi:hypothetical protein
MTYIKHRNMNSVYSSAVYILMMMFIHISMQDSELDHPCLLKSARDLLISSRATSGSYIA